MIRVGYWLLLTKYRFKFTRPANPVWDQLRRGYLVTSFLSLVSRGVSFSLAAITKKAPGGYRVAVVCRAEFAKKTVFLLPVMKTWCSFFFDQNSHVAMRTHIHVCMLWDAHMICRNSVVMRVDAEQYEMRCWTV